MAFFTDIDRRLTALRHVLGDDSPTSGIVGTISRMAAADALQIIEAASAISRQLAVIEATAAAVVADRSRRDAGHRGFAQSRGHRSPASLVQAATGSARSDAVRRIRVGEALLETLAAPGEQASAGESPSEDGHGAGDDTAQGEPVGAAREPWYAHLARSLAAGAISAEQHDAIRRGLGEPPIEGAAEETKWAYDAWGSAAEQLVDEAAARTVEELRGAARALRDLIDPEGAARRFDERFAARSFRLWTDHDGLQRGSFVFDDEAAAWVRSVIDAALRPRRGGPRFVDADEAAAAKELERDPRTNDQLTYDLVLDVLRAGSLADAGAVFGARQAGVRVVITESALHAAQRGSAVGGAGSDGAGPVQPGTRAAGRGDAGRGDAGRGDAAGTSAAHAAVGHCEDGTQTLPAWLIAQRVCEVGTTSVLIDRGGNPLFLGREARLFSGRQKMALALRDGGCRWRGCDRPASYCEAHHIDRYADEGGRTDVDRGILLCRWHHMQLHHGGWRITRDGLGDFILHSPDGRQEILPPRLALRWQWDDLAPPDRRFRVAA